MNSLIYFWIFLKASLLSTGGSGNLPLLHADLIPRGWAADRQFTEALTIGQLSPGPTGLWVVCLGYLTNGIAGAALALVACTIPPFLILVVARFYSRIKEHPAVEGLIRGLGLAVVGILFFILAGFIRSAGVNVGTISIAAATAFLAATRRVPVFVIMLGAALAGIVLYKG